MSLVNIRRTFIYFFFIIFVVNASVVIWLSLLSAQSPEIILSQPGISDTPSLCPGDSYEYSFTVQSDRPSSIDLSYAVLSATSLGSTDVRFEQVIFDAPGTITVRRQWVVPTLFNDLDYGYQAWKPGTYTRRIQARATGSRQVGDVLYLPFEIEGDCFDD